MPSRARPLLALAAALAMPVASCSPPAPKVAEHPTAAGVAAIDGARLAGPHPVGLRASAGPGGAMWLFYPAATDKAAGPAPSLTADYKTALARRFDGQAAADLIAARGPVAWGAAPLAGAHPLLIFTPGASMGSHGYRALLAGLASRGYVVAALDPLGSPPVGDARYGEAADAIGRTAQALAARDAIDGIPIDRRCVAAIGHSLGGAASVLALARSPVPLAGAVNIDGDYSGPAKAPAAARPILYITGHDQTEGDSNFRRREAVWALVANGQASARHVELADLRHFDVHDAALLPAATIPSRLRIHRFGPMGGTRALATVDALIADFLARATAGCRAKE